MPGRTRLKGERFFNDLPHTGRGIEELLLDIATTIEGHEEGGVFGRRAQLLRQFDELADHIELARRKRNYLLTKVRLGRDFHPWRDGDERIFRKETIRPLALDFEPDQVVRRNRRARSGETIALFGEAERETRTLAGRLRRAGLEPFRPHPQAQELRLRISYGHLAHIDLEIAPSANGLWTWAVAPPDCKKREAAKQRAVRDGRIDELRETVEETLTDLGWKTVGMERRKEVCGG
jgi:hypothetical protein